ncbi:MAG: glycosyltransferase family 1 protein, partial [Planctomycetia bacterium]|nr:glycosyltransferase family 1 protein [Planctomycetia bacterium]
AMAAGVPVLTSAAGPGLARAPDAALLVDPYDVEALADGRARLCLDGALRARLVARGVAAAAALPWTATAEGTREAYLRAVA